jgi:hypothetical protein
MRRHPAVHHRGVYKALRDHIERRHKMSFDRFMLTRKADFPWGVSEFNILGQIALSPEWAGKYHFIDTSTTPPPREKLFQAWSYGGLDFKPTSGTGTFAGMTARQIFEKVGV